MQPLLHVWQGENSEPESKELELLRYESANAAGDSSCDVVEADLVTVQRMTADGKCSNREGKEESNDYFLVVQIGMTAKCRCTVFSFDSSFLPRRSD